MYFKKIWKFVLCFFLVGCSEKPLVFNKEIWDDKDTVFINNKRYNMMLWLKDNYNFCDKNLNEISEYLGLWDHPQTSFYDKAKKIGYSVKQNDGESVPYDAVVLYFDFDEAGNVAKAYLAKRDEEHDSFTESIICTNRQ